MAKRVVRGGGVDSLQQPEPDQAFPNGCAADALYIFIVLGVDVVFNLDLDLRRDLTIALL